MTTQSPGADAPYQPPKKCVIIFECTEGLREQLDTWAYTEDVNRSEAIRRAICMLLGVPVPDMRATHGLTKYASVPERRHAKYERRKARKVSE